jgi:hypothetical protein
MARIVQDRALLALRGGARASQPRPIDGAERLALEAMHELSMPVGWMWAIEGAALNMRYLRKALASGDPRHVTRALAQEATLRAMLDPVGDKGAAKLFDEAEARASRIDDPALSGYVWLSRGAAALARGQPNEAGPLLEYAHGALEGLPGQGWMLTNARMSLGALWNLQMDGENLRARLWSWLEDSRLRGDAYALGALTTLGWGVVVKCMDDRGQEAREMLAEIEAQWPKAPTSLLHFGLLACTQQVELYLDDGRALTWLHERERALEEAPLFKGRSMRNVLTLLRANARLAALHRARPEERRALLDAAHRHRHALRVRTPLDRCSHDLIGAQVAAAAGRPEQALDLARAARKHADAVGLTLLSVGALYLEGILEGGDKGRTRCHETLAFLTERGWVDAERAVAAIVPVVRMLAAG